MSILLNNQKLNFGLDSFPMLISGACKTGSSFFSIYLLVKLLESGYKVLFFSAYPAAKEEFRKQLGGNTEDAIIIESGEEDAFLETIKSIPDLAERIILIKNIDNYSQKIFEAVKDLKLVIFSGDLDECQFFDKLIEKDFVSKIFFSQSEKYQQPGLSDLQKYTGKIFSKQYNGEINLDTKSSPV